MDRVFNQGIGFVLIAPPRRTQLSGYRMPKLRNAGPNQNVMLFCNTSATPIDATRGATGPRFSSCA